MSTAYSAKGSWWIAGAEDTHEQGLLTFTPKGGAVLELFGSISSDFPDAPLFVLGTTHDGTQITLPTAIHTQAKRKRVHLYVFSCAHREALCFRRGIGIQGDSRML